MPFLRFTRDRRGYEHTYVLHTDREEGRPVLRVLYWFRTPPGVRVGRAPLDEEAIRTLEASRPDLQFHWARMLKLHRAPTGTGAPGTSARGGARRRAVSGEQVGVPSPERRPERGPAPGDVEETTDQEGGAAIGSPEAAAVIDTELAVPDVGPEQPEPAQPRTHAVAALVGDEGLAVLRARYAELKARIAQRVADPVRRELLRRQVEGLNPDAWVTEAEARQGIEEFEQRSAEIGRQIGARRRRRRKRRQRGPGRAGGGGTPPASETPRAPEYNDDET